MTSKQPPSYSPKNSKSRPSVRQAQRVGSKDVADMPRRRSIVPSQREEAPPSYAPQSRAATGVQEGRLPVRKPRTPRTYPPVTSSVSQGTSSVRVSDAPVASVAGEAKNSVSTGTRRKRSFRPRKTFLGVFAFIFIAIITWCIYLFMYGNSKLDHVEALSGRADTPGETYLIVGSDKREDGVLEDGEEGQRSDTIMLLQLPDTGHAALISLPRDTLVDIPSYGAAKINAAYSYGGAPLLVETVENLTGLTVDHYVEVSMGGVQNLVNAVGGVNLCYDADVSDSYSGMEWTAGCHDVNGEQALSFSRMRYSDPRGDIGRTERQRQVVSKVISKAASPATLLRPWRQRALVAAAAENLTTNPDTSLFGLAQAGLGLRSAMGEGGLMGAPPISNMSYWYAGQSCVQLNPNTIDAFWQKLMNGELTSEDLNQLPS